MQSRWFTGDKLLFEQTGYHVQVGDGARALYWRQAHVNETGRDRIIEPFPGSNIYNTALYAAYLAIGTGVRDLSLRTRIVDASVAVDPIAAQVQSGGLTVPDGEIDPVDDVFDNITMLDRTRPLSGQQKYEIGLTAIALCKQILPDA